MTLQAVSVTLPRRYRELKCERYRYHDHNGHGNGRVHDHGNVKRHAHGEITVNQTRHD